MEANVSIYLDELRPKKNGRCSVKIKVTFNRKRKYYSTGIEVNPEEFERITNGKRKTPEQREYYTKLIHFLDKANTIIDKLPIFSFSAFEESFLEQRNTKSNVSFEFDKYIQSLKDEDRIGTAVSYECAKNSLMAFNKNLTFAEVTPKMLKKYHKWMLDNGKSKTTIGIYLRSLRTIYNLQNIDKSVYPFGLKKYEIPKGENKKKALTIDEVSKIYQYDAGSGSTKEMAKDYWIFLYLCNGMNVKDFCLLKWENIDFERKMLKYKRAKTERSNKEDKEISVALKPEAIEIIKKWGQVSISKEMYVFPHIHQNITPTQKRAIYQQLTKTINKYIKRICKEVGINKNVTSYFARHSFATILKNSGAGVEFISELLGHSSVAITSSYLDSFEDKQIQEKTDVLTVGFSKTN